MPLRLLLLAVLGLTGCKFSLLGDTDVDVTVPEDAGIAFVNGYWEFQKARIVPPSCGAAGAPADSPAMAPRRAVTPPPD